MRVLCKARAAKCRICLGFCPNPVVPNAEVARLLTKSCSSEHRGSLGFCMTAELPEPDFDSTFCPSPVVPNAEVASGFCPSPVVPNPELASDPQTQFDQMQIC